MFNLQVSGAPRIAVVAAARPNFMKVGPVLRALQGTAADVELVHTGQHYDERMSERFFRELGLPEPDVNLGVGSGTHAQQTAGVLVAFEQYLDARSPDVVVVVGDVNSTVAASLAATKLHVPVAHVEAGLRSGDWTMPEEINRVVTDRLSRWLFTTSLDANENLRNEGVPDEWVHLVGNTMIDTLLSNLERARKRGDHQRRRLELPERFAVLTLHRPSNVDDHESLARLITAVAAVNARMPVIFPIHPRTGAAFVAGQVAVPSNVRVIEPLGYLDFVGLLDSASVVFTDSGGVQEETSVLGVPCLTLRDNTERPITCQQGTNRLVGRSHERIVELGRQALATGKSACEIPMWDGLAGERIARVLLADLSSSR